jgi:hypothetical protein
MRQIDVGSSQREGSARPLPHSENTRSQALVEESVERRSRAGGKSTIASVLPRLIQGLVLLGQMALQQEGGYCHRMLAARGEREARQADGRGAGLRRAFLSARMGGRSTQERSRSRCPPMEASDGY